jgi:hypothetical protein
VALVNRVPQRDEVWLVSLDPTHGAEIKKTRPSKENPDKQH